MKLKIKTKKVEYNKQKNIKKTKKIQMNKRKKGENRKWRTKMKEEEEDEGGGRRENPKKKKILNIGKREK